MISDAQKAANAAGAIATGLLSLIIPVPLTTVQWANKHYYLPKESSYTPGRWETLPFQVGIMNCMGNDLIRTVTRAEDVVLCLSGMIEAVRPDTDITEVAKNNTLTDDDFSAGKSSTAS